MNEITQQIFDHFYWDADNFTKQKSLREYLAIEDIEKLLETE